MRVSRSEMEMGRMVHCGVRSADRCKSATDVSEHREGDVADERGAASKRREDDRYRRYDFCVSGVI